MCLYSCTYSSVCVCLCVYVCDCMCAYMYTCVPILYYLHVCMWSCEHACECVSTHVHIIVCLRRPEPDVTQSVPHAPLCPQLWVYTSVLLFLQSISLLVVHVLVLVGWYFYSIFYKLSYFCIKIGHITNHILYFYDRSFNNFCHIFALYIFIILTMCWCPLNLYKTIHCYWTYWRSGLCFGCEHCCFLLSSNLALTWWFPHVLER